MGTIILKSIGLPELLPQRQRSPGIHISDIIRFHCVQIGLLDDYTQFNVESESSFDRTLLELGNAVEFSFKQRYALEFPHEYIDPGEIIFQGEKGTPDLLHIIGGGRVIDFKATYRSSGPPQVHCQVGETPPIDNPICSPKFYKDWMQVKAYCYMLGWTVGVLIVVHLRGGYSKTGLKVDCFEWEQTFTKSELAENWLLLMSVKREMTAKGIGI